MKKAKLTFEGKAIELDVIVGSENEIGIDIRTGNSVIHIDKKHYRPAEVDTLLGNPKKANDELNWKATTSLEKLAHYVLSRSH